MGVQHNSLNATVGGNSKRGMNYFRKTSTLLIVICLGCFVSNAQSYQWAKNIGGYDFDYGHSIAVDSDGNVYTTGSFFVIADLDPGPDTNISRAPGFDNNIFISKLNKNGNYVWAKGIGGVHWDEGYSIALDAAGNVYTAGRFGDTVDFDPGAGIANLIAAGRRDIFISKLDSAGNFIWAKSVGDTTSERALSIALDKAGNVYTTGSFLGTVDFDPGAGTSHLSASTSAPDIFVLKLVLQVISSGQKKWEEQMMIWVRPLRWTAWGMYTPPAVLKALLTLTLEQAHKI
ncbi:MAG: hypothetical protein CMO34_03670 [Verrucomicrobia bacterium]|nr:hypothetical protein [Verrucomicrobiota bacterium]